MLVHPNAVYVPVPRERLAGVFSVMSTKKSAPKFELGDVVRLKSGGPSMTIVNAADNSSASYHCAWFIGGGVQHGSFPPECLVKAKANRYEG